MSSGFKQIVGTALMIVGYAITPFTGWGYALVVAGAALSYDGARQAAREAERRARASVSKAHSAVRGNVRGSFEHHLMVFGRARVGGLVAMVGTTDAVGSEGQERPDAVFWVGLEHSIVHAGGCHGMRDIWIDDVRVPASLIDVNGNVTDGQFKDLVQVKFHAGTGTQAADATTVALGLDYADAYRRGICWSWASFLRPETDEEFRKAFPYMSIPTITAEIDGIKCYDPRKDSTNGGSGSHRYNDELTWEFSNNPALCAATYSIMKVMDGGEGIPPDNIVWSSVATAANICDETLSVPKYAADLFWNANDTSAFWGTDGSLFWETDAIFRFRCDGVLSTTERRRVNLQKILDSMLGVRIPVGSKYKFYPSAYLTPTVSIDNTWLAGPVKITTQPPLESRYNAVRINYDDRAQDYKTVEAPPFTSAAYEAQDGGVRLWRDMTLPMVSNGYNAQYLAMILGAKSRKQTIVELTCNLLALDIEVWENCTLDLSVAGVDLSGRVFKCVHWQPTPRGIVLTLQEDASSIYTPLTFQQQDRGTPPAIGSEVPGTPQNLVGLATADGIRLDWTVDMGFALAKTEIYRARYADPNAFVLRASVPITQNFYVDDVPEGGTFIYKVKAVSRTSRKSDFSNTTQVTAKVSADAAGVEVLNGHFEFGNVYWSDKDAGWSVSFDPANSFMGSYCGKFNGDFGSGAILNDKINGTKAGNTIELFARLKRSGGGGSGRAMVRFYDIAGLAIGDYYAADVSFLAYAISQSVIAAPADAATYRVGVHVTGASAGETWFVDMVQSKFTPKEPYNLTVEGSGQQVGDQRNLPVIAGLNVTPAITTGGSSPLTASDAGASASINVAQFTVQGGFGTVVYNAGSVTGLAFSTTYYVYVDDPTYSGGAVSYFATTTASVVTASKDRVYVGFITTPADGGGGTGGGGACVAAGSFVGPRLRAHEARAGDLLLVMDDEREFYEAPVQSSDGIFHEPCADIVVAGGAAVTCSLSTPFTLRDGRRATAASLRVGDELAARYGERIVWEPVTSIAHAGVQPVVRLHAHRLSYAAGSREDALIYTHNPLKP